MRYRAFIAALLAAGLVAATAAPGAAQTGQQQMPENHRVADFWLTHGQSAQADATLCAVCHARDYCSRCHVNAYKVPAIQALQPDPRVAEYVAETEWPAPPTHTPFWLQNHQAAAAGASAQCETCHVVEQQCQICHLGSETAERPRRDVANYHPINFLEQHSAAAFNREFECASCHNPEVFCRSCHIGLGRATTGRTDTGFHNENPAFSFGHGQAARQGLESCASCHAQQDCLACHSAKGNRRINPHGPDFDADKLRSKNKGLCLFCHFSAFLEP